MWHMKIVCSGNMPFALEAFRTVGETTVVTGRAINADDLLDADILAIRSTTLVNRELIEGSPVRFVGTATIGFDHIDTAYLKKKNIRWCAAAGCNANSVSEYIVSALLCLASRHGIQLSRKTIGIIGVGHVGSLVAEKARALGMTVMLNDPPRERSEGTRLIPFVPLDKLLRKADVITMHVPLVGEAQEATYHMANRKFFGRMKPGALFINSARGQVVDVDALLDAIDESVVAHAVIDTWDPEPAFPQKLVERVDLATPHIAGHSFEGKVTGTLMVYREVCRFLGLQPTWSPELLMPPPAVPRLVVDASAFDRDEETLWSIVRQIYNIEDDDQRLRSLKTNDPVRRAEHFERIRMDYAIRREFPYTRVLLKGAGKSLASAVANLGFNPA